MTTNFNLFWQDFYECHTAEACGGWDEAMDEMDRDSAERAAEAMASDLKLVNEEDVAASYHTQEQV